MRTTLYLPLGLTCLLAACVEPRIGVGAEYEVKASATAEQVPDAIPASVQAAALAAVPGLVIEAAEEEGGDANCVHGRVDGVVTEVEVDAAGNVLEVETGVDED